MVNFEYILQKSPLINLEQAHFKMTQEYIDLIGTRYTEFVKLLIQGFELVKANLEELLLTIEILTKDSKLACVSNQDTLLKDIQKRLDHKSMKELVVRLLEESQGSWTQIMADQKYFATQGIQK